MAMQLPQSATSRLPRRNPFSELEREIDEFFGRFLRGLPERRLESDSAGWVPPIDMIDRRDMIVLRVDLPGMDREDVEVTVKDGTLTLQGARQHAVEREDEEHYVVERWSGAFTRSLSLPHGVREDKIEASFRNGVLEIRIPKTKASIGRRIAIKAD